MLTPWPVSHGKVSHVWHWDFHLITHVFWGKYCITVSFKQQGIFRMVYKNSKFLLRIRTVTQENMASLVPDRSLNETWEHDQSEHHSTKITWPCTCSFRCFCLSATKPWSFISIWKTGLRILVPLKCLLRSCWIHPSLPFWSLISLPGLSKWWVAIFVLLELPEL